MVASTVAVPNTEIVGPEHRQRLLLGVWRRDDQLRRNAVRFYPLLHFPVHEFL